MSADSMYRNDAVPSNLGILGIQAADLTGAKPTNTETDQHKGITFPSLAPAIRSIQQALQLSTAKNPWCEAGLTLRGFEISNDLLVQISLLLSEL